MDSPMFQKLRTEWQALGTAPVALTHARGLGLKATDGTLLYAPGVLGIPFDELAAVSIAPLRRQRRSAITQLAA
jgi:hypothetical protein